MRSSRFPRFRSVLLVLAMVTLFMALIGGTALAVDSDYAEGVTIQAESVAPAGLAPGILALAPSPAVGAFITVTFAILLFTGFALAPRSRALLQRITFGALRSLANYSPSLSPFYNRRSLAGTITSRG